MLQAVNSLTPKFGQGQTSLQSVIISYLNMFLTEDRWTVIPAAKIAAEVGASQSAVCKALRALVKSGKLVRQTGHGRKDAFGYRRPPKPQSPSQEAVVAPIPKSPVNGGLGASLRHIRAVEKIMETAMDGVFENLLATRGALIKQSMNLRATTPADVIERLKFACEQITEFEDEPTIGALIIRAAIADLHAI